MTDSPNAPRPRRLIVTLPYVLLLLSACENQRGMGPLDQAMHPAPSVDDALVALGEVLFFDKILSGNRDIACATCHLPSRGTDDDRALPRGVGGIGLGAERSGGEIIPRNSPALFNLHEYETMFWDSRVELRNGGISTPAGQLPADMEQVMEFGVVSAQALFPVTSRSEMRGESGDNDLAAFADDDFEGIWAALMQRLSEVPTYVAMFEAAYPGVDFASMTFAHAANALAGYEVRAFEMVDTPFQRFLAGDANALSPAAQQGRQAFIRARCNECHSGPLLSDFRHHNTGLAQFGPGHGDGAGRDDFGRERVTGNPDDRYKFRTTPLINLRQTGPYGHAGQYASLELFVEHYHNADEELRDYQIDENVDDEELWGTLLDNREAVLQTLDADVRRTPRLNAAAIVAFLNEASAANSTLTSPAEVPSGLSVD
ncbi:MAG: cytochrome c peroxidase [Polyangiales bacterium]|jgi:cytochrome c peroxidase